MVTLLDARQTLAPMVGPFAGPFTTTSAGTATTLICTALMDVDFDPSRFGNAWALMTSGPFAGTQRQIDGQGLDVATGTLTTTTAFPAATLSGVTFEVHFRIPAKRTMDMPGCLDVLNEALRLIEVVDRLPITAVTGQKVYELVQSSVWWLHDARRIIDVYDPVPAGDTVAPRAPINTPTLRQDFERIFLDFDSARWTTGQTAFLEVRRPANSRLKLTALAQATVLAGAVTAITPIAPGYYTVAPAVSFSGGGGANAAATAVLTGTGVTSYTVTNGGAAYTSAPTVTVAAGEWGEMTSPVAGLVGDTDEAKVDLLDVCQVARHLAFERLMMLQGSVPNEWQQQAKVWEAAASRVLFRKVQRSAREQAPKLNPVLVGGRLWGRV